jgi:hypothetical protein
VTEIDNVLAAEEFLASTTVKVNGYVPADDAVPVMVPPVVVEEIWNRGEPGGNPPAVTNHKYGAAPPLTVRLAEYAAPTLADGRLLVAIVSPWPCSMAVSQVAATAHRIGSDRRARAGKWEKGSMLEKGGMLGKGIGRI